MNTFTTAVTNQEARTANGMKAQKSTSNACVDLFFKIGASRGKDITPAFVAAFADNKDLTLRIAQWSRDVREGAGERQLFRDILVYLEKSDLEAASLVMNKIPELGRWDDLLVVTNDKLKAQAFEMIATALKDGNALCAKWMPRKGTSAIELRKFMGMSPKQYRKTLVGLTDVVETAMCAKQWDKIDFSKLPSLASARYRTAFHRNSEAFKAYVEKLADPKDNSVKVNAGAVYPYDVLKSAMNTGWSFGIKSLSKTDRDFIVAQWDALPNYVGDNNILPMVDVSGSMSCPAGGKGSLNCMDVAVSLGLYLADKNTGAFHGTFSTFSGTPEIVSLKGNVLQMLEQMSRANMGYNTNLIAAFQQILKVAVDGNVPQEEMPKVLLILSDMQFDACARFDDSAMESIRRNFEVAGYEVPRIVFWNINASDNVPVKHNEAGVALVSGFSPVIVKNVLNAGDKFDPENIMLETIMSPRYDLV